MYVYIGFDFIKLIIISNGDILLLEVEKCNYLKLCML